MLKLVDYNDKILYTPTVKFDFDNPPFDILEFNKEMMESMYNFKSIGLSANQVGFPYSIFVMKANPNWCVVNPRIVSASDITTNFEEGCLTFPGLILKIKRPKIIRVRFQTPNGEIRTETFSGLTARTFIHEYLHLKGLPFFHGFSRLKLEQAVKKSKKSYNVGELYKLARLDDNKI